MTVQDALNRIIQTSLGSPSGDPPYYAEEAAALAFQTLKALGLKYEHEHAVCIECAADEEDGEALEEWECFAEMEEKSKQYIVEPMR